ncbi:hypothetical protein N8T08_002072 [Aspergillus melleus]|uniref:Uncharacterized protein n=1 Tax=Aspergillus melleus TaxID=138277 RepID=A0ACC3AME1_9EURO|nr:hypothetical protein N8T08_002072 [Aspergillus melleus]
MEKTNLGVSPESGSDEMKTKNSDKSTHLEDVPRSALQEAWHCESPNNPRNWAQWKKDMQILMVAFHSMVATMAAGIILAYDTMADEYNMTVPEASYLTSIQV